VRATAQEGAGRRWSRAAHVAGTGQQLCSRQIDLLLHLTCGWLAGPTVAGSRTGRIDHIVTSSVVVDRLPGPGVVAVVAWLLVLFLKY
jgi:hypothetical protein